MDRVLKALAQPQRLDVVRVLLRDGPRRQVELCNALEMRDGTVSKHLRELLEAELVDRSSARGSCRLIFPEATLQVLEAAAALDRQIAARRAARATAISAELAAIRRHRDGPQR